jgi:hypothetical protein
MVNQTVKSTPQSLVTVTEAIKAVKRGNTKAVMDCPALPTLLSVSKMEILRALKELKKLAPNSRVGVKVLEHATIIDARRYMQDP